MNKLLRITTVRQFKEEERTAILFRLLRTGVPESVLQDLAKTGTATWETPGVVTTTYTITDAES